MLIHPETLLLSAIFRNPYHYCGTLIARLCVCSATILWAGIVLWQRNALAPTSYGSVVTQWANEDVYGWLYMTTAAVLLYRLFRQSPPHWVGILGYGVLMVSWLFVAIMLWLHRPFQLTSIAWVTPGAALAVFAFVGNRKRGCNHAARL